MTIPAEYAWVIPVAVPFLIGIITGVLIKRIFKVAIVVLSLIIVLVAVGYIQLPDIQNLALQARNYLPQIQSQGGNIVNLLPYASGAFLVGLALGLWKG